MIEIVNRYTRAVLYSSATANTIAEAVAEAVNSGANLTGVYLTWANLTGANLAGANLAGAYNILRISGGRHDIVAVNTGQVSIGCHTYPIERWMQSYAATGTKEGYSPEEIEDYGERLKLVASWIARLQKKQESAA